MRLIPTAAICLTLTLTPVAAQDSPGSSLMEEGAKLFLRGLMSEAEPMLDEMGQAMREMEPALREMGPRLRQLVDLMGDVANYDAPERLPCTTSDVTISKFSAASPPEMPAKKPATIKAI